MKKITNLEYQSLMYLLAFPLFMGVGISKMIRDIGSDIWISMLIGTALGLLIIFLFKKLPEKNNKYCSLIINSAFILLGTLIFNKLVGSIYLSKTPNFIIMIPGYALLIYTVYKGKEALFKTSSILIIIFILLFLTAAFVLIPSINIDYFLPVKTNSFSKIILSGIDMALLSTTPLILLPKMKNHLSYKNYLLSSVTIYIIIICTLGNLGVDIAKIYRYPEYMVFKKISLLKSIENIENILFMIWIIAIYNMTSIASINIKEDFNYKVLFGIYGIVVFVSAKYLISSYKTTVFILKYFTYILLSILVIYIVGKVLKKMLR